MGLALLRAHLARHPQVLQYDTHVIMVEAFLTQSSCTCSSRGMRLLYGVRFACTPRSCLPVTTRLRHTLWQDCWP
jgi:hypothetical protein